ncbi:hypothetical protein D3C76_563380 [compost metagenome]
MSETVGELAELFEQRSRENRPDMLTEAQIAAHLGMTKRAIQSRRDRGQFPPEVCQKVGPTWFYSLSRFEAWLDSHWPPVQLKIQAQRPVPKGLAKRSPSSSAYLLR